MSLKLARKYFPMRVPNHGTNFETNVGLAQDTSRQFDWVNIIYSSFAPSTTYAVQALVNLKTWRLPFSLSSQRETY